MPKETFKQLPPQKQEHILTTAAQTLAAKGYAQTEVAEISTNAGVAKGSLYNYFDSKEDLYLHVCRDGLRRSREAVYQDLSPDWDIYRQVEHIFRRGREFVQAHPEYIRLYLEISSSGMERFAEQLSREVENFTAQHLKAAIRQGQGQGIVAGDLNVDVAAFVINSLYITCMISLGSRHFQIRFQEYMNIDGELHEELVSRKIDEVIQVIHRILKPSPQEVKHVSGPKR